MAHACPQFLEKNEQALAKYFGGPLVSDDAEKNIKAFCGTEETEGITGICKGLTREQIYQRQYYFTDDL